MGRAKERALVCVCGGLADVWKGNGPNGRYAYAECPQCQRKTDKFGSAALAEAAWFRASIRALAGGEE